MTTDAENRRLRSGIFLIHCPKKNRTWVGKTTLIHAAWDQQKALLNLKQHPDKALQKVWDFIGGIGFVYEVAERCLAADLDETYAKVLKRYGNDKGITKLIHDDESDPFPSLSVRVGLQLHPEANRKLRAISARRRVTGAPRASVAALIREAIDLFLDQTEV